MQYELTYLGPASVFIDPTTGLEWKRTPQVTVVHEQETKVGPIVTRQVVEPGDTHEVDQETKDRLLDLPHASWDVRAKREKKSGRRERRNAAPKETELDVDPVD